MIKKKNSKKGSEAAVSGLWDHRSMSLNFFFATVPPSGLDEYKYRTIFKWFIPPTYYHINECQHYTNVHKSNKK